LYAFISKSFIIISGALGELDIEKKGIGNRKKMFKGKEGNNKKRLRIKSSYRFTYNFNLFNLKKCLLLKIKDLKQYQLRY
jgi:hypothetical protein